MTSTKRLYLAPDAPAVYASDHYLVMDKVGSESAVKILASEFMQEVVAARNSYSSLDARLDAMVVIPPPPVGTYGYNLSIGQKQVYCLGDSITAGFDGNRDTGRYPATLQSLLGSTWSVLNRGVDGQNVTVNLAARYVTDIVNPSDGQYAVVLGGVNDLLQSHATNDIEAALQEIYSGLHDAGVKVVAVTILPFKGNASWSSGLQSQLDAINTWILNTATDVDYTVDAYTSLEDVADTLNAAYDCGDHLHLNAAGYDALATAIHADVTWGLNRGYESRVANTVVSTNQSLLTTSEPQFAALITEKVISPVDSTTGIQFMNTSQVPNVIIDTLNARVGIGIPYWGYGAVEPAYTLHVVAPIGVSGIIAAFGAGGVPNPAFSIGYASGVTTLQGNPWGNLNIVSQSNNHIKIVPNGTGKVGIGSDATPNYTAQVFGSLGISDAFLNNGDATVSRLYTAVDGGKRKLYVAFPTGAAQLIATEP